MNATPTRARWRSAQDGSPVKGDLGRSAARHWVRTWLGLGILLIGSIASSSEPPVAPADQPTTAVDGQLWASNKRPPKKGSSPDPPPLGRQAHKDWDPGEGFEKEVELPSGKRADAVNWDKREVKEFKPDNPRAIKRGERQVEEYRRELEEAEKKPQKGPWKGQVETYKPEDIRKKPVEKDQKSGENK